MDYIPKPPNPLQVFIQGLSDPDADARIRSANAITLAAEEGINANAAVPFLMPLLSQEDPVAVNAAQALEACFFKGGDFNAVLPALEVSLQHPLIEVRKVASRIVSRYKVIRGEEVPLKLDAGFKMPPSTRSGAWSVSLSHRRTYALEDKFMSHEAPRLCGNCSSTDTDCIFVQVDPEEGSSSRILEYKCRTCGKYTLYTYEAF